MIALSNHLATSARALALGVLLAIPASIGAQIGIVGAALAGDPIPPSLTFRLAFGGVNPRAGAAGKLRPAAATTAAPSAAKPAAPASPAPSTGVPSPTAPAPGLPSPAAAPAAAPAATRSPPATDAGGAIERARAAYEYGDIDEMIESARQVTEGRLHGTPSQRAHALRYLGIGLFLTGRPEGAEAAFFELLRLRPESRLDPQTTRPDVVAFFEQVRLRYAQPIREAARANNKKLLVWNFFPPAGQFQNGHSARGWTIAGLEFVTFATATASFALLRNWQRPDLTFPDPDRARAVRTVNWISIGALGAVVVYGIIDGLAHYPDLPDETAPSVASTGIRPALTPDGLAIVF